SSSESTRRLRWRRSSASRRVMPSATTQRWVDRSAFLMEHPLAMQNDDFLAELDRMVKDRLSRIAESAEAAAPGAEGGTPALLAPGLKKELEAAEEAAIWLTTEDDVDVKPALARQCGDEAKHYRLIEARLRELGVDTAKIAPLAEGYSPMFKYLKGLGTTGEPV